MRYPRPEVLPPATDRFVVVEASAGTGKTYFLEHRVVDLILAGARLDQILVVTFTDKAVAELRMRVRDLLDRMARATESSTAASCWELDDDARARLRASAIAFDRAPIFTIHGFCHRVLIEDAFAARRPLQQEQIIDEVAFDAAYKAELAQRFAIHEPARGLLAAFLEKDKTVDHLRDLLLGCARTPARTRRGCDVVAITEIAERLRARFSDPAALAASLGHALKGRDVKYCTDRIHAIAGAVAECPTHPARVLAALDPIRVKMTELVERAPALAPLLHEAILLPTLDEAVCGELLPHVVARVGSDKAERGQFDYDDMLRLVRDALHDGTRGHELAARLRERTPWVLIDEFQDTDPVQWDIFRTAWLAEGSRGLAIVGDPKQAIYGFRGADVATYVAARDELERLGATTVQLDTNRRSVAPLVDAINDLLLGAAPLQLFFDREIRYDQPVRASADVTCGDSRPPVTVFALQAVGRDANREALVEAIGAEVERLRAAPPAWQRRGAIQPFTLSHVMMLTRSNKESLELAAALRGRGLPCALVESDRLFDTREAHELAAVLAAIAAPRDRSARLRALRTRFFDVPWTELMQVVDAPDHHPAIARLHEWAALAARRAYEPLFRRLVEDSCFAERALVLGGGERAIVNTWHVIELLLEEVARARCDLHALVVLLRRWIADEGDQPSERDVQRLETDADAIRVLTIHKAKGLEAPYVFLYGGAGKRKPVPALLRTDDATHAAENQRLGYVALTRAQVRLYLPRYGEKGVDDESLYAPIQRALVSALARAPQRFDVVSCPLVPPQGAPPGDALAGLDLPAPPVAGELARLPAARAGLAMLSYTRLAHGVDQAAIDPAERARPAPLYLGPAELATALDRAEHDADVPAGEVGAGELPPGVDSGIYLHDLLEHADLARVRASATAEQWAADPAVHAMLVHHARARGISQVYLPHAARVVHAALTRPLALHTGEALPPLAAAPALAREVEFAYPIPGKPGLVRGFIDVLVAWDDELWVLDYKSDVLADPARAPAHVELHYEIQQRLYALAAMRLCGARRLAGLLFAFVRHGVTVAVRTPGDRLEKWAAWLERLRIEEGS
ncbi:MAG: UvrD-helicase domain-containing protein [Acidobacteriota bacterium]